jgi:hypothetical protein
MMQDLIQFANDRPTALNDDLYQWAADAEENIRSLVAENERLQLQSNERGALAIANGIRMERAEDARIQQAAINALLRVERDACIKDKQRLDWFNTGEGVFRVASTWYYKTSYFKPAKRQKDIRAAIDAGMKA